MTTQPDLFTLPAARTLRDEGQRKALDAEPETWTHRAEQALDQLIRRGEAFSSDTLCELVGRPLHANAVGALMHRAVKSDRLVEVGRVQSQRVAARGRNLPLYVGAR